MQVALDVLRFSQFKVGTRDISQLSLADKSVRVLLEHLMLSAYGDAPLVNA